MIWRASSREAGWATRCRNSGSASASSRRLKQRLQNVRPARGGNGPRPVAQQPRGSQPQGHRPRKFCKRRIAAEPIQHRNRPRAADFRENLEGRLLLSFIQRAEMRQQQVFIGRPLRLHGLAKFLDVGLGVFHQLIEGLHQSVEAADSRGLGGDV